MYAGAAGADLRALGVACEEQRGGMVEGGLKPARLRELVVADVDPHDLALPFRGNVGQHHAEARAHQAPGRADPRGLVQRDQRARLGEAGLRRRIVTL